jgi:hypothetical protein
MTTVSEGPRSVTDAVAGLESGSQAAWLQRVRKAPDESVWLPLRSIASTSHV